MMKVMREPIGQAFNWTEEQIANMTFFQMYMQSDIIFAEMFEGNKRRYDFS